MRFLSVCSGIEAASVAWEPLGWKAVGYAEIEPFPGKVLHRRFGAGRPIVMPEPTEEGISEKTARNRRAAIKAVSNIPAEGSVPNHGDFTAINLAAIGAVDLLVGGTPCQAFSIAGKRLSLADARGNLSLAYTVLAHELARSHGLRWAVWENVPGVLSTDDNAFGCLLGAFVGADDPVLPCPKPADGRSNALWRWKQRDDGEWIHAASWPDTGMVEGPLARAAWGILDAQYFGLAQRRERVFVVVGLGDGADPAAVLFEPQGLRRHPPPRREAGEAVARPIAVGSPSSGGDRNDADTAAFGGNDTRGPINVAAALSAHGGPSGQQDFESETFIAQSCIAQSCVAQPIAFDCHGGGHAAIAFDARQSEPCAFDTTQITSATNRCNPQPGDPCHPLAAQGHPPSIAVPILGGRARSEAIPIQESGKRTGASSTNLKAGDGIGQPGDPMLGADSRHAVATSWAVRRLTPTECERLQGFPDGWTNIPGASDRPRYKALGNSMAVPVMAWIGQRIDLF